jgi:hypothetical protein
VGRPREWVRRGKRRRRSEMEAREDARIGGVRREGREAMAAETASGEGGEMGSRWLRRKRCGVRREVEKRRRGAARNWGKEPAGSEKFGRGSKREPAGKKIRAGPTRQYRRRTVCAYASDALLPEAYSRPVRLRY